MPVEQEVCNWRMSPQPERLYSYFYWYQVAWKSSQASKVESASSIGRGNSSGFSLSPVVVPVLPRLYSPHGSSVNNRIV